MIAKKLFSVHSPVWQLLFTLCGILVATSLYAIFVLHDPNQALTTLEQNASEQTTSVSVNIWLMTAVIIGVPAIVAYSILCSRHNKKGGTRLHVFSRKPNEIIGDDERLLQASANAALKLYAQNHVLFPALALALIFAVGSGGVTVLAIVLMASVVLYYSTYLAAMWPYLGE